MGEQDHVCGLDSTIIKVQGAFIFFLEDLENRRMEGIKVGGFEKIFVVVGFLSPPNLRRRMVI